MIYTPGEEKVLSFLKDNNLFKNLTEEELENHHYYDFHDYKKLYPRYKNYKKEISAGRTYPFFRQKANSLIRKEARIRLSLRQNDNNILNVKIGHIPMSYAAFSFLYKLSDKTVGTIAAMTWTELQSASGRYRGIGPKTMSDVIDAIAAFGVTLKSEQGHKSKNTPIITDTEKLRIKRQMKILKIADPKLWAEII